MCELKIPKGFSSKNDSTPLLDLLNIEISDSSTSPSMKRGYGYIPLRSKFAEHDTRLFDPTSEE